MEMLTKEQITMLARSGLLSSGCLKCEKGNSRDCISCYKEYVATDTFTNYVNDKIMETYFDKGDDLCDK
jgi:hypothetical protein